MLIDLEFGEPELRKVLYESMGVCVPGSFRGSGESDSGHPPVGSASYSDSSPKGEANFPSPESRPSDRAGSGQRDSPCPQQ